MGSEPEQWTVTGFLFFLLPSSRGSHKMLPSNYRQHLFEIYDYGLEMCSCQESVCGGSRGGSGGSVEPPKLNVM